MQIAGRWRWLAMIGVLLLAHQAWAVPVLVQKTADDFEAVPWSIGDDSRAKGEATLVADVPAEKAGQGGSQQAMQVMANFSGGGFEPMTCRPAAAIAIPGVCKRITMWVKGDSDEQGWILSFRDGWGRSEYDGKKLEWYWPEGPASQWREVSFDVPADWVQPITITGLVTHNWAHQSTKYSSRVLVDQLQVQTDIADVDPATGALKSWKPAPGGNAGEQKQPITPLLSGDVSVAALHNVFVAPQQPSVVVRVQSWRQEPASAKLTWKVIDWAQNVITSGEKTLTVTDRNNLRLPVDAKAYGLYALDANLVWEGGATTHIAQPMAYLPAPRQLSAKQKDDSPYGLNVLAARKPMVETFTKAGITWYRDYGFDYDWMVRAKGTDKNYGGWPWYPPMVAMYAANDARVLACLKGAIRRPQPGEADMTAPDANWSREIASILMAFPYIRYYELDNEYDLSVHGRDNYETRTNWQKYRDYHKRFGEIANLLGGGEWVAVENGRGGIFPERERQCAASGDFANIQVINSHHYTGIDPPEVNVTNFNTDYGGAEATLLFFDQLRAAKAAGGSDGKARQHWLTEFGWDTKAGPVVTPLQQAVFLQRGYMTLMAAGCEKGFWFFDLDAPKAVQFFDGCGLVTDEQWPKLSLCAFAGLTQILPTPRFVGIISAGEGTWGYLFRNGNDLVAALYTLEEPKGPTVTFDSGKLYDYLANPIAGSAAQLTPAPTYAVGVSEDSLWFRQSAYILQSPYLVTAAGGDTVTAQLLVTNGRKATIHGTVATELPQGWTGDSQKSFVVEPGQKALVPLVFRVSPDEKLGEKTVKVRISEDQPVITIPLRVRSDRPVRMAVSPLKGAPGETEFTVRLTNLSAQDLDGVLNVHVPQTWSTTTPRMEVAGLKPKETREVSCRVKWSPTWQEDEAAYVEHVTTDGRLCREPIIPNQLTIYRAPAGLKLDGDLADWPAANRLPGWVLGCNAGAADTEAYVGWMPDGLAVAVSVKDSKVSVPDPKAFWGGDCLELFVDTRNQKSAGKYQTSDHQFWVLPMLEQGRVYVGEWKRDDEIPATRYDIAAVKGVAKRTADGYVMEFVIPASELRQFAPKAGASMGLNLNLSVQGKRIAREVYWPASKGSGAPSQPAMWGSVELAE